MKQAAWAAWYHMASTDDQPMHDYCNPDHCGFYLDFDYKHDGHSLPPAVCAAIKPAYEELCRDESLRQVLRGGTTNANESFHRIIWSMCSKKRYDTQKRIINATNLAVIIYNDGFIGLMPIYRSFGITVNIATIGSASMKTNRSILCSDSNNAEETVSNGFELVLSSLEKILTNTVLESLIRISIE